MDELKLNVRTLWNSEWKMFTEYQLSDFIQFNWKSVADLAKDENRTQRYCYCEQCIQIKYILIRQVNVIR